jgi:hypothetical protein
MDIKDKYAAAAFLNDSLTTPFQEKTAAFQ